MRPLSNPVVVAVLTRLKAWSPRARRRTEVARRHLRGSGLEIGALHNPLRTSADVRYVDRLSLADLRRHYPELAALPVVEPDIVDDGETLRTVPEASQDFIVANHFIEHCEDPIGTLQTFVRRLRPGGIIYLVVPDKRYTFDLPRPSTTWEHLVADHADGGRASRWTHYLEFATLVPLPSADRRVPAEEQARSWEAEGFSIHFHVWTATEFEAFVEQARKEHLPEVEVVEAVRNGDETIFVLQRS